MKKRILACAFAVLTLFCSCAKETTEEEQENENATKIEMSGGFDGGLHEVSYTPTSDYLVKK